MTKRLNIALLTLLFLAVIQICFQYHECFAKSLSPQSHPGEIIVLRYDRGQLREEILVLSPVFSDDSSGKRRGIHLQNKYTMYGIRFFDRSMRFVDKSGMFHCMVPTRGNAVKSGTKNAPAIRVGAVENDIYVVERNLRNPGESLYLIVGLFMDPRAYLFSISNPFDQYFPSSSPGEILAVLRPWNSFCIMNYVKGSFVFKRDYIFPEFSIRNESMTTVAYDCEMFNPLMHNSLIASEGISRYRLFLNFNYYNYLRKKFFIRKFPANYSAERIHKDTDHLKFYKSLFSQSGRANYTDLKKYGYKIFLTKREDSQSNIREGGKNKIVELAANYPLYPVSKTENIIPVPHKCWSPSGDRILFVGSQEKPGVGNVYTVRIKDKKIDRILNINDTSGRFNPGLQWTNRGILITCRNGIYWKPDNRKIRKLEIPAKISEYWNGRISPSGDKILFFGKTGKDVFLYCMDLKSRKLISGNMGREDLYDYQGAWINAGGISMIKDEADFYTITDTPENDKYFEEFIQMDKLVF